MNNYQIFNKLIEGVQVIDREMRYLYLNEVVAQQCKSTIEELLGERMLDKFPTLAGTPVYSKIENCMLTGNSYTLINEFTHNDGSLGWFDLRIEPIDDGVIIFSFDITPQKLIEKELNELNANFDSKIIEKTSELEECFRKQKELSDYKTNFVSIASHQFRTPLTSIILSASMVEQYGSELMEKEKMVSHFGRIKSSANHMVSVLNDFLSLEDADSVKFKNTPTLLDFHSFAQSVIDSVDPLLKDGQKIELKINPIPCDIFFDEELTRGILLNLLSNAIKYSAAGSLIILKGALTPDAFEFEVKDQGIGIPEKDQSKLFSQFYRASNAISEQGTGLGLNIVKQFVDKVGGEVRFDSIEGEGSTFHISLPQ